MKIMKFKYFKLPFIVEDITLIVCALLFFNLMIKPSSFKLFDLLPIFCTSRPICKKNCSSTLPLLQFRQLFRLIFILSFQSASISYPLQPLFIISVISSPRNFMGLRAL